MKDGITEGDGCVANPGQSEVRGHSSGCGKSTKWHHNNLGVQMHAPLEGSLTSFVKADILLLYYVRLDYLQKALKSFLYGRCWWFSHKC